MDTYIEESIEVSVVVPVYNVEKFLRRCVESILKQDFERFEIILVDDGSTDSSGEICDEYAEQTNKVRVIHKENGGLSDARNCGTKQAKGHYVTYVDSDDSIEVSYVSSLFSLLNKYDADMSFCGFNIIEKGCEKNERCDKVHEYVISGKEAFRRMLLGNGVSSSACAILVNKETAMKYEFPLGKYHEDDLTSYKYYLDSVKVAATERRLYNYFQNSGSIMHSLNNQVIDLLYATENFIFVAQTLGEKYKKAAECRKFLIYIQIIDSYPNIQKVYVSEYNKITCYLNSNKWRFLINPRYPLSIKRKAMKFILNGKN